MVEGYKGSRIVKEDMVFSIGFCCWCTWIDVGQTRLQRWALLLVAVLLVVSLLFWPPVPLLLVFVSVILPFTLNPTC